MKRTVFSQRPRVDGEAPIDEKGLRGYDREELVKLLLAFGSKPYRIEFSDAGIMWYFVMVEIKDILTKYYNNETMIADWRMFVYADTQWRDIVVTYKAERRADES